MTLRQSYIDKDVYELAKERVHHCLDLFDTICVAFSGGKDSTATLEVALEVCEERGRLPLIVNFFDEEAIPYETEEYVRRRFNDPRIQMNWIAVPVKHRNACSRKSPFWYPWNPEEEDKWVRPKPPEAIGEDVLPNPERYSIPELVGRLFPASKYGTVGNLMGIRTQESLNRLRILTKKENDNYISVSDSPTCEGNMYNVYPIYDWTTEDVWTAPKLLGWDYNTTYDVLDKAGMSAYMQRCSPPFGEEPLQKLWSYKVCFPDIWDKMSTRVPGANTAIRYGLTELYAYGGTPEKPADMTWEQYISHFIKKFQPKDAKIVASRVRQEIKNHYRKTKDPILPKAKHPVTGISWDFLLKLAMRGDFKGRKQAGAGVSEANRDRLYEKYNAELEELKAKGEIK
jgi:predicted phosphoadenosine phosphosulfate sulfurtransferase